ncbi:hypothetical protein JTB14_007938 [Gonioctena quinquepunctata]|nr:hypothetical protein JTB14_007938 [Gonioctena quinquepunctata]
MFRELRQHSPGSIEEERVVTCDSCQVKLHLQEKCSGLGTSETRAAVLRKRVLAFFCLDCRIAKKSSLLLRKMKELNVEVNKLKTKIETSNKTPDNLGAEDILKEIDKRTRNSKNIMMYNMQESHSRSLNDKKSDDNFFLMKY